MSGCCKTGRSCTLAPPLADARRPRAENPKRARRMARRSLAAQGVGTKAQQALALARGAGKQARTAARREQEQADRERRFALRVQRRKEAQGQVKTCPCAFQTVEKNKEVKEKSGEKSWRWQSHASLRSKVQATRRMPPKRGGDPFFI